MRMRLLRQARIIIDRQAGALDFQGTETQRLESDDPDAIMGFGETVLRAGSIATFAILLGKEVDSDVPPSIISALELLQTHNNGNMAIIEEATDAFVYWRFLRLGQGLPILTHHQDEPRTLLFESHSPGMMRLLNDEAEKHGFATMVLSDQASVLRDTNARLLLLGTLAGFMDGTRSYGSLTARTSIFVDRSYTLMSLSDEAIRRLEFTELQAILLSQALDDAAAAPLRTESGTWRLPLLT